MDSTKLHIMPLLRGIMALAMMVPGMLSGWIQEHLNYEYFFILGIDLYHPRINHHSILENRQTIWEERKTLKSEVQSKPILEHKNSLTQVPFLL